MKTPLRYTTLSSPVGTLTMVLSEAGLCRLTWGQNIVEPDWRREDRAFAGIADQLAAYFAGKLREFEVELDLHGTDFQQKAWAALRQIPYGETRSYGEQARLIGSPKGFRAVGMANNRNPVAIIVPCHRVIGANGQLIGFGGGLDSKRFLLNLEKPQILTDVHR